MHVNEPTSTANIIQLVTAAMMHNKMQSIAKPRTTNRWPNRQIQSTQLDRPSINVNRMIDVKSKVVSCLHAN